MKKLWEIVDMEKDEHGFIRKGTFLQMMVKLHVLIVYPPVDLGVALSNATKDWERDSRGSEVMDYSRFIDSMFELVDIWTDGVEEEEYTDMLDLIREGIAKARWTYLTLTGCLPPLTPPPQETPTNGRLCWKPTEEIQYDPRITKVPLTMDDLEAREDGDDDTPTQPVVNPMLESRTLHKIPSSVEVHDWPGKEGGETKGSSPSSQRHEAAIQRWEKASILAKIISSGGGDGTRSAVFHYLKGKQKKLADLKVDRLLPMIAKIYKAKAQVDTKMTALEEEEGHLGVGKNRKYHRLDRFILQYHIRQFGTKSLARKKLRQFLASISKEGPSHPRITLFAKLCGVPICEMDCGYNFKPFAASDYFLPILKNIVPPGEDLDHFMGTGRERTQVPRAVFMSAVVSVLSSVPEKSPAMQAFENKARAFLSTFPSPPCFPCAITTSRRQFNTAKTQSKYKVLYLGNYSRTFPSREHIATSSSLKTLGRKKVDLDEALLAVVPLWQAEVGLG
ncbi:unnamed protein product [Discosporangium mesarthrocarpum]